MTRFLSVRSLAAAGLLLGFGALGAAAQDTVIVTPEQEVVIQEYVATQPAPEVVERPSNFELVVGAIIPDIFKPGALAENTIPDHDYQYVVIDNQTVLIDPETREIVHIIK